MRYVWLIPFTLLFFMSLGSASYGNPDKYCEHQFHYVWPTESQDYANDITVSGFSATHPYIELQAENGHPLYAICEGMAYFSYMGAEPAIVLDCSDNKHRAIYWPVENSIVGDGDAGKPMLIGEKLALAAGDGQVNFQLLEEGDPKSPFLCAPNSCLARKTCFSRSYFYDILGITPGRPSYVCGDICSITNSPYTDSSQWYSFVYIDQGGLFIPTKSKVFNDRGQPEAGEDIGHWDKLNCFFVLLRVHNNGVIECGKVDGTGKVLYSEGNCDEYGANGLAKVEGRLADSVGYLALDDVSRVEWDGSVGEDYGKTVVVSSEYQVLGVYDKPLVKLVKIIEEVADDCINKGYVQNNNYRESGWCCGGEFDENNKWVCHSDVFDFDSAKPYLSPEYYPYHIDYVLARRCDLNGVTGGSIDCKNTPMSMLQDMAEDYNNEANRAGFEPCEWNILDGGKYYDSPGTYLRMFPHSRFSSQRGSLLYNNLGYGWRSLDHIYPESIGKLYWWNNLSASRLLGCDGCGPDSDACTMGAAIGGANFRLFDINIASEVTVSGSETAWESYMNDRQYPTVFRNKLYRSPNSRTGVTFPSSLTAPYFPEALCGYWNRLDLHGSLPTPRLFESEFKKNIEGRTADYFNPVGDKGGHYDYESGIPEYNLVRDSIESLKGKLKVRMIVEASWRQPPHWLNTSRPNKPITIEDKLMPCHNETERECRWTSCRKHDPEDLWYTLTCNGSKCQDWEPGYCAYFTATVTTHNQWESDKAAIMAQRPTWQANHAQWEFDVQRQASCEAVGCNNPPYDGCPPPPTCPFTAGDEPCCSPPALNPCSSCDVPPEPPWPPRTAEDYSDGCISGCNTDLNTGSCGSCSGPCIEHTDDECEISDAVIYNPPSVLCEEHYDWGPCELGGQSVQDYCESIGGHQIIEGGLGGDADDTVIECDSECTGGGESPFCPEGCCVGGVKIDEEFEEEYDVVYGARSPGCMAYTSSDPNPPHHTSWDDERQCWYLSEDNVQFYINRDEGYQMETYWDVGEDDFVGCNDDDQRFDFNSMFWEEHPGDTDRDYVLDRAWTWTPREEGEEIGWWGRWFQDDLANKRCSRPNYGMGEGEKPSEDEPPETPFKSKYLSPNPHHNPTDVDQEANLAAGSPDFNYDPRYYRLFNINTVWSKVFKVTPELHYFDNINKRCTLAEGGVKPKFIPVEEGGIKAYQCLEDSPGKDAEHYGVNGGDCDGDSDCADVLGRELVCLNTHAAWGGGESGCQRFGGAATSVGQESQDNCCPKGACWDYHTHCCAFEEPKRGIGETCNSDDECYSNDYLTVCTSKCRANAGEAMDSCDPKHCCPKAESGRPDWYWDTERKMCRQDYLNVGQFGCKYDNDCMDDL
ncbi:MAG: hypothetical protein GF334_13665, partial [Candidatus Altiarchaeales archaeon]|nr:hypothetical protein [Candidatus Altiarchaeales archaeon]